jgi:hypothetical protein
MDCGYELKVSNEKGEGIFSTKTFHRGDTVMVGEIEKELDGNNSHASQVGENKYILHAGLISKVNHSCNPNCGIKVNKSGAHDFVSIKTILKDQEMTFDYAMRNYGIDHFPKECLCGEENCRGKVTGWKVLPEDRKKVYEGFVAPYLLELDKKKHL